MSELGLTLAWAAVQVTLLALAGAALYAVAARRGPGAGAPVAAACLFACAALTLLALCPLPAWWNWPTTPRTEADDAAPAKTAATDGSTPTPRESGGGGGVSLDLLRRGWDGFRQALPLPSSNGGGAWAVVAVLFLAGAALGLLRLLLGLWAIGACRRRSIALNDSSLRELLDALCGEMGCPPVEVREAPELATAAAAGWRRPLVLLPTGWRAWSGPELRAALAHELAHIRRRDYLTGLLARLCVALHFYHPLLRWLAARLRLQQELAADALGAQFAGGPMTYLRALASLALRQDGPSREGPALALFSSHGMLMRRIHMLRSKSDSRRSPSGWGRSALVALLVAAALGVSALRSPAQKAEPAKCDAVKVAPFDVSFVPTDAMGVIGFRPARAAARPGLKDLVDAANDGIEKAWTLIFEMKAPPGLRVEQIEQAILTVEVHTDTSRKEGQSSMVMRPNMFRTVEDFDWARKMHELAPDAVKVERGGKVYYQFAEDLKKSPLRMIFGPKFGYYLPDGRTIVFDNEDNLKRLLDRKPGAKPAFAWAEGWKRVENDLLAVVLDNSDRRFSKELEARDKPDVEVRPFHENAVWMAFGINGEDDFVFRSVARCRTEKGAEAVQKEFKSDFARLRKHLAEAKPKAQEGKKETESAKLGIAFLKELMRRTSVRRDGTWVEVRGEAKIDFTQVFRAFCMGEFGL